MPAGSAEIRELALTNSLTDSYLILGEILDLKRSLSLELDLAKDRRQAHEAEFQEFMAELWDTLNKIRAQFRAEAELLNLIEGPERSNTNSAGDHRTKEKPNPDRNSPESSILSGFISHKRRRGLRQNSHK
jgi:hypothetical protein